MKRSLSVFSFLIFIFSFFYFTDVGVYSRVNEMLSSVFFADSTSTDYLKNKYNVFNQKIKVLIVPGHDDSSFGAAFGKMKEADLTLSLGKDLAEYLGKDSRFQVVLARNDAGYEPAISNYIAQNSGEIEKFISDKKKTMTNLVVAGGVQEVSGVPHVSVPFQTAVNLYGVNKWANDNGMDLVIHIHFNDYPRKKVRLPGEYTGVSIYVPDSQYSNSKPSHDVAASILEELNKFYPTSNMPKEKAGVVSDQKLIAIGAYNTLDSAGLLAEYGYIYEPQVTNAEIREKVFNDMALQTYLGIVKFFDPARYQKDYWKSALVPYSFDTAFGLKEKGANVASLQAALTMEGVYPPADNTKNDCPLSGVYGNCTFLAVKDFQKKYGFENTGFVGKKTLEKLNLLYSSRD